MFRSAVIVGTLLAASANAVLDTGAKTNVALYFGSGLNQQQLAHYCTTGPADVIPLAFVNEFLTQGNGYPGTNFGASTCNGAKYTSPGYMGSAPGGQYLDSGCLVLSQDIQTCQSLGKKIVLSLGGAVGGYRLESTQDAVNLADVLWATFGPLQAGYTGARPFDLGSAPVSIDGFDFDIESTDGNPRTDVNQGYYEALINRLRINFATDTSKQYLITGAPQCIVPDANMNSMITNVAFDIVWVQYYNTPQCSARNWVNANPNFATTGIENPSDFQTSWVGWTNTLRAGASRNAKLYIGIPGAAVDVADASYVLQTSELSNLLRAQYFCDPYFGGIMIYEAEGAERVVDGGITFTQSVKNLLLSDSQNSTAFSCVAGPSSTSTAVSSTIISSTITSTSTGVSTTATITSTSVTTSAFTSVTTLSNDSMSTATRISPVPSSFVSGVIVPTGGALGAQTTSTVRTTYVSTIYSCASTVVSCPYSSVITSTVDLYTTICPIAQVSNGAGYTPSTMTSTNVVTITACASAVTDCPARTSTQTIVYITSVPVVSDAGFYVNSTITRSAVTVTSTLSRVQQTWAAILSTATTSGSTTLPTVQAPVVVYSTVVVVPQASAAAVFVTVPSPVVPVASNSTRPAGSAGTGTGTGTGTVRPTMSLVPFTGDAGRNTVGSGLLLALVGCLIIV